MVEKDYYGELGLDQDATPGEVRSAYRRLARKCHPDVNPDDCHAEERIKAINEAYAVLSDPVARRAYDARRLGSASARPGRARTPASAAPAHRSSPSAGASARPGPRRPTVMDSPYGAPAYEELVPEPGSGFLFRRGRRQPSTATATVLLELTPSEAWLGTTRLISVAAPGGTRVLELWLPPGLGSGSRLRFDLSPALAGSEGMPGWLEVVVSVRPRPRFF